MDKKNIIFNNITIVSKSGKNLSSNIKIFVILSFRNTTHSATCHSATLFRPIS